MNPALLGLATALGWGGADFIARFTGRAMGHDVALLGMLIVGVLFLTPMAWIAVTLETLRAPGPELASDPWNITLLVATGIGIMVATLLLYWGLARGPVTLVAPLVGAYPALNVAIEFALGARPTAFEWGAMAVVLAGTLIVARSARSFEDGTTYTRADLRKTTIIALASAAGFAVAIAAAQRAGEVYGDLNTVMAARWISLVALLLWLVVRRRPVRMPMRWWPWLALQGLLDGTAYIALVAAGSGEPAAIAVVVASGFSAVTVILARLILREAMTWPQWAGIGAIVGGVMALSAA